MLICVLFFYSFSLTSSFLLPIPLTLYMVLIPHLTYLLRLLSCPIPGQFIILTLCYLAPVSLSLSLLFLLAVMFSLLYHPSFWPVCALVPRCVWVKMCLLCRGDASLRGASPAGHYNFHWECVLPCVCVWLWSPQKLVRNIQLISLFSLLTLTHPSFSFLTGFLLYYFGDTLEDYPADLYQIWRFRQLEGKLWSEARPERCELLNVSGCLRGLWSSFVTVWAI